MKRKNLIIPVLIGLFAQSSSIPPEYRIKRFDEWNPIRGRLRDKNCAVCGHEIHLKWAMGDKRKPAGQY